MPLIVDDYFAAQAAAPSNEPVLLIDIPSLDGPIRCGQAEAICGQLKCGETRGFPTRFSNREIRLSGRALCGSAFAICGQIKCGGNINRLYEPRVRLLSEGGVGRMNLSFDRNQRATSASTSIELMDTDHVIREAVDLGLVQQRTVRIILGFPGGSLESWVQIFEGVVDQIPTTDLSVRFDVLDGSFTRHEDLPEVLGGSIFGGAPRESQGQPIPIVLGSVQGVKATLVETEASSILTQAMGTPDLELHVQIRDTATFPRRGRLQIDSEIFTYGTRQTVLVGGVEVIRLGGLLRTAPVAHAAGATVETLDEQYAYLFGHGTRYINVARLKAGDGTLSAAMDAQVRLNENQGAIQPLSLLGYTALQDGTLTVDVDADNVAQSLLLDSVNPENLGGAWVVSSGSLEVERHSLTHSPYLSALRLNATGGTSQAFQDFAMTPDTTYLFSGYVDGEAGAVVTVQVGITSAPSLFLSFNAIAVTPGSWLEVSGRFDSELHTNGRIMIQVQGSADGFFGSLRIRPLEDETPSKSLQFFASRYLTRLSLAPDALELLAARRQGWRTAVVLDQVHNSKDILTRLSKQLGGRYFEDFRGRGQIGIPDIVSSSGPIFTFDESQIVMGSVRFDLFKSDDIYTEFHVYYNRDASLGQGVSAYRGHVYTTPTSTNIDEDMRGHCKGAQGIIGGQTRRFDLLADFIGDRETAELSLKHHIRDKTFQGYEVWLSAFLNAIHLQPTDLVSVDLDLLPTAVQGANFEVVDRAVDWNRVQTSFRLRQVPVDPNPLVVETRLLLAADDLEPAVWMRDELVQEEFPQPGYSRNSLGTDEIDTET